MAKVQIENGEKVVMHQLQVGDKVQTGTVFLLCIHEEFTYSLIIQANILASLSSLNSCVQTEYLYLLFLFFLLSQIIYC